MKITVVLSRKEYDAMLRAGCVPTRPGKNNFCMCSVYDSVYTHKDRLSINEHFFMDVICIVAKHKKQIKAVIDSIKAFGGLFSDMKKEFKFLCEKWG